MNNRTISITDFECSRLMQELIEQQRKQLLSCARRIIPHATSDDILQPNDFPELENHPHFRYEEGILDGLQVAQAALLRAHQEISSQFQTT